MIVMRSKVMVIVGDIPRGVTRRMYGPARVWRLTGDPPGAWRFTDNPPDLGDSLVTRWTGQMDNKAQGPEGCLML